jgi:hypothetical protein
MGEMGEKMTRKQLTRTVKMLMDLDLELLAAKNHDYSDESEALSNFRAYGWKGIAVLIEIKARRLEQLAKGKKPKFESVIDTLRDMSNFCYLGRIVYLNESSVANSTDVPKSSCCDADVTLEGERDFQWFQCTECGEPCDIK